MPIENIEQPEVLPVSDSLRLRKYDGKHDFALSWYLDPETVWLVDGDKDIYTPELLDKMYTHQDTHGELYFIEFRENDSWKPIGDVCLSLDDFAIVIGEKDFRGKGVGRAVVSALIDRARALGWEKVRVGDVYDFNDGSRRMFTSLGFREEAKTAKGHSYILPL
ncbi:MAG: GNAT family N-acetyltransferase [Oscillibacter sp.]|nr:GNAT family N-acetyltransferase [Oscillibacter sp.]MBD5169999.1 GNAT family N-acetyltransferase [Oscillibacter sp.]